jgi:hypothetical protein
MAGLAPAGAAPDAVSADPALGQRLHAAGKQFGQDLQD